MPLDQFLFQPTLPLRGATSRCRAISSSRSFNPRSPCGERRYRPASCWPRHRCFNPRSPCGERLVAVAPRRDNLEVSTHAPLAGSDHEVEALYRVRRVSTHAPLAGSDALGGLRALQNRGFQPTLPLRGATADGGDDGCQLVVSTHAPLAGSDTSFARSSTVFSVSTHAPLAGSDRPWRKLRLRNHRVSTHAPLAGSDGLARGHVGGARFNPRSPCGERPLHLVNVALRAYHMHDVFHPNASSDELRPSETNQKAVRTSQGIPDSPQFAPPIIPTAYS